nr:acyltransferase [Streptomyces noursei]
MLDASPPQRSRALPSLTGMRFVAALLVFIAHVSAAWMFTDQSLNKGLSTYLGMFGSLGVSFFFLLSGFVLTWSARDGDRSGRFWRRRLTKIYPTHFVTWVAALLLGLAAGQALTAGQFLPGLFLVQTWVPDPLVLNGVNSPAWSLSVELVFYLCFPVLIGLVKKIRPERLWWWAGAMVLGALLVATAAEALLPHVTVPSLKYGWLQFWIVYFVPVSRLFEFGLGMLLARIVMTGRWIPVNRWVAALTLIPGYLLSLWIPTTHGVVLPVLVPLGLTVASWAHADAEGRTSPLGGRTMVWLGEISFAFYMLQLVVGPVGPAKYGSRQQWDTGEALLRATGWLALTIVLAWILYRTVELPMVKRWSRPRHRPQSQAVPLVPAPAPVSDRSDVVDRPPTPAS